MDIKKLTEKAERKIALDKIAGKGEFVFVRLFPMFARTEIRFSKLQGIDPIELLGENEEKRAPTEDDLRKNPEIFKKILNDKFDMNFTEYKKKVLKYGLDPVRHSFKNDEDGSPVVIDDEYINRLSVEVPALFEFLVKEVEKYQDENSLGE